ncbi:uncharacterized protein IL334_000212 [Kwoniella shivajii]|uniref:Uncharacterized protein n=1 Tax=Kwoniella shivajii TaxID=564305 RepID=A0ABZ1CNI3_9TREE|nr:hypothetical protein IL334_000212 [Kwoniella shivajii]
MQGHPGYPGHPGQRGHPQHGVYPPQRPYHVPPPRYHAQAPPGPPLPMLQPTVNPTLHIAASAPFAPTPSLMPGPFILLFLLPAIPLLLFSVGARPPDTSHLPFSTSDAFATGAFVTIAGVVVLCLGVYPEAGGAVWTWIREGGKVNLSLEGIWPWTGEGNEINLAHAASGTRNSRYGRNPDWEWHYDGGNRKWIKVPFTRPGVDTNFSLKGVHSLASRHLTALREVYSSMYTEYKPKLIPSLLVISLIIFILVLLFGAILGNAYDNESKPASSVNQRSSDPASSKKLPSWVEREVRKRKEEKPEMTIKRIKAEGKKEIDGAKKKGSSEYKKFVAKRESEKEILKKELQKRKLPLIGLEDKQSSKEKKDKNHKKKKEEEDDGEEEEGKSKRKNKSTSEKVKKLLLGEKSNDESKEKEQNVVTAGPGWEIADPSLAQNTLARSGQNAQHMAEKLKKGG